MATSDDIITMVQVQLSSSATLITDDGYLSAVSIAESELGWTLPISDGVQVQWMVKRVLRHVLNILWIASAQKFKYKTVNLNQRFEHYEKLITSLDKEYQKAISEDTSIFSSVESYKQFGTAINAGFVYDKVGNDLTYTDVSAFIKDE